MGRNDNIRSLSYLVFSFIYLLLDHGLITGFPVCIFHHWNAWNKHKVSLTLWPTGKSLTVIWRNLLPDDMSTRKRPKNGWPISSSKILYVREIDGDLSIRSGMFNLPSWPCLLHQSCGATTGTLNCPLATAESSNYESIFWICSILLIHFFKCKC